MRALLSVILAGFVVSGCALQQSHEMRTSTLHTPLPDWQAGVVRGQPDVVADAHGTVLAQPGYPATPGRGQGARAPGGYFQGGARIAGPHPGVTRGAGGRVQIELNDADIGEAAKAVLGDVMRVSYSIDPKVTGKISLKTRGPATPDEALAIFETALGQNNAAIVQNDGVYAVVPLTNGATDTASPIVPGGQDGPGFTVRAVELRHIAAGEMAEILKPTAKSGIVRVDAARNVIVLSGTGAQHRAWAETVRTFDVDWLANRSVGVFKVDGMPAQTMIASLTEVMRNENVDATLARFIVIDSNNSILAVAKTRDVLASIRRWVQRLEQASGSRPKLHTYEMRYAQAKEAAKIVSRVLGIQVAASEADLTTGSTSNGPGTGSPTNGLGRGASANAPGGLGSAPPPATPAVPPTVQSAQFALPGSAVQLGGPRGEAQGLPPGAVPAVSPTIRIVPNDQTNTLLVYGTESDYQRVLTVLRSIDNPQRQVLVEAAIIEVTLNDTLRHGVQWEIENIIGKQVVGVALRNGDLGIGPETPGFAVSIGTPIKAIVDALGEVTSINVISSPNLMVTNNQSARLAVGDQVPITTSSRTSNLTADNQTVNTIEFRDTGIIFDVTPRINSANSVTLNIAQEVSAVQRSAQPTLTPTISQRRLNSAVTVEHGETIVLGGLFSNESTRGRAGVPGLSAVPGLGNLFGRTEHTARKTELLVLISPKIVNDAYDSRAVTREITRRMTELQLEEQALAALVCTQGCDQTIQSSPLPPVVEAPPTRAATWSAPTIEPGPLPADSPSRRMSPEKAGRPALKSSMK